MIDVQLGPEAAAVRELELREIDVPLSALVEAIEAVVAAEARMRTPLLEPFPRRHAHHSHERDVVEAVAARAVEEPHLGIEGIAHLDEADAVVPGACLITRARAVREVIAATAGCLGLRSPPVERPALASTDAPVDAVRAVMVARILGRHALHGDRADARSAGQLAGDAGDGVGHGRWTVADVLGEHLQHTDREPGDPPRHAPTADDRYRPTDGIDADAACEE